MNLRFLSLVLSFVLFLSGAFGSLKLDALPTSGTPLYPSPNERFGFGVTTDLNQFDVSALNAGWYVNWGTSPSHAHNSGLDYVQIIRLCDPAQRACGSNGPIYPSGDALTRLVQANPGTLWLVGNEPDSIYQDDVLPETYATLYHRVYDQIKSLDPGAQVAIGGVVEATPLRLAYLDRILNAYQGQYGRRMPVDVWNVHLFILQELKGGWGAEIPPGFSTITGTLYTIDDHDNLTIFTHQIKQFRQWMSDRGERDKPLIASEYGILFNTELGYPYARVKNFMLGSFNTFLNSTDPAIGDPADQDRLVQRWAWYSLDDLHFEWGDTDSALFNPDTHQIRPLGNDFTAYTQPLVHPWVDVVAGPLIVLPSGSDLALALDVTNLGNSASAPATMVFSDTINGATTELGRLPINAVPARYGGEQRVKFHWAHPARGLHTLTAAVVGVTNDAHPDNNRSVRVVATGGSRYIIPIMGGYP